MILPTVILSLYFFNLNFPGGFYLPIGPYPGLAICRDWLGSMDCEHGPTCILGGDCSCKGPGIAASIGATADNDCYKFGLKQGYYYFSADDGLHGPMKLRKCKKRSDECFGVGKISNTEGSPGGP